MMTFVGAGAAAVAGQLDPVAFDAVDLAERSPLGVDHLHMLANLVQIAHLRLLRCRLERLCLYARSNVRSADVV